MDIIKGNLILTLYAGMTHDNINSLVSRRNVYTRDYCGDIIYKDGEIERILTDNGYAVPNAKTGGYDYYYYVKEYQGNVHAVIDENNRRVELNGYYPYGMPMHMGDAQPYKYGSKELDRTNGLDLYDFSARWYAPDLPRFLSLDPLCEKYPSISPYAYCAGNPVRYIDPTGKEYLLLYDDTGKNRTITSMVTNHFKDDPHTINIFAHGSKGGMQIVGFNGGRTRTAEEFVNVLDSKSEIWKNRKNNEPVTIILHSCQTGDGEDSFAAKISEELENVTIIAPNGNIRISEREEQGVFISKYGEKDNYGNWNVFQNGKQTMQLNGKTDPRESLNAINSIKQMVSTIGIFSIN